MGVAEAQDNKKEKNKRRNPREKLNILTVIFFWWIFPLLRKSSRQDLHTDDLYTVLKEDESGKIGDELAAAWDHECVKARRKKKQPKFYKALLRVFGKAYALHGITLMFSEIGVRVAQVICLHSLIASMADDSVSEQEQYLWATGVVLATFTQSLLWNPAHFGMEHIGMKCRVSVCSLIYRKTLKLSKKAEGQTTVGQIVNLLSGDVNRFDWNLSFLHYLYIGPLQMMAFTYVLWTMADLEISTLAGVGFAIFLVFISSYAGKHVGAFRQDMARRTDHRAQVMSQVIIAMRIIKMYAWEKSFTSIVNECRRLEINVLRKTSFLKSLVSLFFWAARMLTYLTVLTFVLMDGELKAERVFLMVTIYNIMRRNLLVFVPIGAMHLKELRVSVNRIESFLLLEEKKPRIESPKDDKYLESSLMDPNSNLVPEKRFSPSVTAVNACGSWAGTKETLTDISCNLQGPALVMVVGAVGSGKTSFLHMITSELPLNSGSIQVHGKIAYAAQEAWIFSASIRENILFGRPFDEKRYTDAIQSCALDTDLEQLAYGDSTLVGDRGITLSGGQKARVNLGRALYGEGDAQIYLLDDPLSAVDAHVSRRIVNQCITTHLKNKLVVLATHQLQYLPQADHIIVLKNGKILNQGTYNQLVRSGVDFVKLVTTSEQNGDEEGEEQHKSVKNGAKDTEANEKPKENEKSGDDKPEKSKKQQDNQAENMAAGSVTIRTYWNYFRSGNSFCSMCLILLCFATSQVFQSSADYWLKYWTDQGVNGTQICETDTMDELIQNCRYDYFYLYVYTGLVVGIFVLTNAQAVWLLQYCMRISTNIHNRMLANIIRAPAKFFDENPSGRILNRFTKDMGAMDEQLPSAFAEVFEVAFMVFGALTVVIISNYFIAIPAIALLIALGMLRQFYMRTSRQVKRIEAITRSPVFTHVIATVHGITTIRASNSENILIKQFDNYQDVHSSAWFCFIGANRWLTLCLEVVSSTFVTVVAYSFLVFASISFGGFTSGAAGLAISSALSLSGALQYGMRQSAAVENNMTSVERALEYTKLVSEAPLESSKDKKPPKNWPNSASGEILFDSVSLSYSGGKEGEGEDVLKNVTFDIKKCEKIGIVGRTGAGKSSIIAALFRMTEPRGSIMIDGVRVNDIGLHDLRKVISIIPQEPFLFSASMRSNLDPFDEYSDDQLWKVIQDVELKEAVPSLDFSVADGGSNFSVGERQLVCLARALLRQNSILVMDEATANIDPRTDALIQRVIRTNLVHCTTITIAHRLASVMDCGRILVLDNGYVKEYDSPQKLMENPHGYFTSLVIQSGLMPPTAAAEAAAGGTPSSAMAVPVQTKIDGNQTTTDDEEDVPAYF